MKKLIRSFGTVILFLGLSSLYFHINKNQPLATLTLTGSISQEEIEWKNPLFPLEKAMLPTYEVFFSLSKQKPIHAFFWGEVIGIRYKVLELHSFFHWIGWKDFVEIEALCSDYISLEKKQKFPSKVLLLENTNESKFANMCRTFWKRTFQEISRNILIQRATLKIEYFPLSDVSHSFLLSYQNGKLIAN